MDRHAKLSRLRYLLNELVEHLLESEFDPLTWSDIIQTIREIEQLSRELAVGRVLSVEGDQVTGGRLNKCGRVQSWRPTGRTAAESLIVHPRGGDALSIALWETLRRAEFINNLRRWVRFVEHLTTLGEATDNAHSESDLPELLSVDVAILRRLAEQPGVAIMQDDLAAAVDGARKTIGGRLKHLRRVGYVKHPDGSKYGNLITPAGSQRLATIP